MLSLPAAVGGQRRAAKMIPQQVIDHASSLAHLPGFIFIFLQFSVSNHF
jgi:hypothetical protein